MSEGKSAKRKAVIGVIGGQKGGTGKSTLAVNAAVFLAGQGKSVLLIDTDNQGSAGIWAGIRSQKPKADERITTVAVFGDGLRAQVLRLAPNYDAVIIDTTGLVSKELRSALTVADWLLSPVRTGFFDVATMSVMTQVVEMARDYNPDLRAYVMVAQAATNDRGVRVERAAPVLADLPGYQLLRTFSTHRASWEGCGELGIGVQEYERPDPKAVAELEGVMREVLQMPEGESA